MPDHVDTSVPQTIAEATVQQINAPVGEHASPDQERAAKKRKAAALASGVPVAQEHPSDSDRAVKKATGDRPVRDTSLKGAEQPKDTFAAPDPNPPKGARRRGSHTAR